MKRLTMLMLIALAAHAANPSGWLFLHGGAGLSADQARSFLSYAGTGEVTLAVIPSAMYPSQPMTPEQIERERHDSAEHFGAAKVIVMDARTREEADSPEFSGQLRGVQAVWIVGGSIEWLAEIYTGTRTEREVAAVLERGGVVGGTSAGAMIPGSFLVSRMPKSPLRSEGPILLNPKYAVGFGLLPNVAIDPHFRQRKREGDMEGVVSLHPELLGLGIDEKTAAIVHDGRMTVIGPGQVLVFRKGQQFVALAPGADFVLP